MAWVHNLDPFAIQFTEAFGIRWYGLAYLMGFITGYFAILKMTRKGGTQFTIEQIADFVTYAAIGVLAGGRLGYCLFYAPDLLTSFDNHFPYWGVLKVNEGGMASHGGILGVLLVSYIYARKNKISFLHCQDLTVYGGSLGFFFGRIANFINGELYGREAPPTFKWPVKFPQEMNLWVQKDFGKMPSLSGTVEALGQMKTDSGEMVPLTAGTWQSWLDNYTRDFGSRQNVHATIEQIIAAIQNGNQKVTEAIALVLTPRYPSQLFQAVLEGLLVFLILVWLWRKPRKPGVIAGWFATLYCLARIIGEQFRMPDAHIGFQFLGLTRGQWLSIAMLAVAVLWLVICMRRNVPKLGGWKEVVAPAPARKKK